MEHINRLGEPHRVDGTVRVAVKVINDLQHAGAAVSSQRFGVGCLSTHLRLEQRKPHPRFTSSGNPLKSSLLPPTQRNGFGYAPPGIPGMNYAC